MAQKRNRAFDFAHANMRLRTRYGIEMSMQEWEHLNRMFAQSSPKIVNPRKNHVGDVEGWVEIGDVWVCAYWSVQRGTVSTFFARPPDIAAAPPKPAPKPAPIVQVVCDCEKHKVRGELVAKANQRARIATDDVAWFKARCIDIARVVNAGAVDDAADMLSALGAIPKTISPTGQEADIGNWLNGFFNRRRKWREEQDQ